MAGETLHIATDGLFIPSANAGSNPLAQGSSFHLGANVGIFGIAFTADTGRVSFNEIFDRDKNALLVETTNAALTEVHGAKADVQSPFDLRIQISGVCYSIPLSVSRRIRGKNGARVHWQTTTDERGSFRFFRRPPAVFR